MKVTRTRVDGSCPSEDDGTRVLAVRTGWRLWTYVAQPCKLPWPGRPGNQTWRTVQVRTEQAQQSPRSHCQLPSMLHCPPQECTTLESGYIIQEAFHVFLGVCSGNSHPHCRPHTWVAAGADKPPLPAVSLVQQGFACAVPPAWESSLRSQGSRDQGEGCLQGMGSLCPYPPTYPDAQVLSVSLREKRRCFKPFPISA